MRWLDNGDLMVVEKTEDKPGFVLRQVGWLGQTGRFYAKHEDPSKTEPGSFSPVYIEVGDY